MFFFLFKYIFYIYLWICITNFRETWCMKSIRCVRFVRWWIFATKHSSFLPFFQVTGNFTSTSSDWISIRDTDRYRIICSTGVIDIMAQSQCRSQRIDFLNHISIWDKMYCHNCFYHRVLEAIKLARNRYCICIRLSWIAISKWALATSF